MAGHGGAPNTKCTVGHVGHPSLSTGWTARAGMLTIQELLESRAASDELRHAICSRSDSGEDDRYDVLASVEPWRTFSQDLLSSDILEAHLARTLENHWNSAWIPDFERLIYCERQLEALFHKTLISRVNFALRVATMSLQLPAITIVVSPGSFDSYHPDGTDGKGTTIRPDWVVVQGDFSVGCDSFPDLDDLASEGRILVVGDTKIGKRKDRPSEAAQHVTGSISCRRGSLAQVQHYCTMLRTRFGFVLSDEELLVAQFLREEDATPRSVRQRGLRSFTQPVQLDGELQSGLSGSDTSFPGHDEDSLPTPTPRKRMLGDGSPGKVIRTPPRIRRTVPDGTPELPSSPPRLPQRNAHSPLLPTGRFYRPDIPVQVAQAGTLPLGSSSPGITGLQQDFIPSTTSFAPTDRCYEVGRVLALSYKMPNGCTDVQGPPTSALRRQGLSVHPAKALFALIMLAGSVDADVRMMEELDAGQMSTLAYVSCYNLPVVLSGPVVVRRSGAPGRNGHRDHRFDPRRVTNRQRPPEEPTQGSLKDGDQALDHKWLSRITTDPDAPFGTYVFAFKNMDCWRLARFKDCSCLADRALVGQFQPPCQHLPPPALVLVERLPHGSASVRRLPCRRAPVARYRPRDVPAHLAADAVHECTQHRPAAGRPRHERLNFRLVAHADPVLVFVLPRGPPVVHDHGLHHFVRTPCSAPCLLYEVDEPVRLLRVYDRNDARDADARPEPARGYDSAVATAGSPRLAYVAPSLVRHRHLSEASACILAGHEETTHHQNIFPNTLSRATMFPPLFLVGFLR
ncbi:hypothetical protein Purlil1_12730 [Purpureocillium lilacinum]|uniref:PD-(D/E)XK endonuclease-like domain-containing protein n=1 Tax=Purpureocillium lilacinum TaxID=33203 RepID=A0ABR0BG23_PURLI|nr:hypothetical protein Purlil1_12730 [Purpureocillium lilacinum]